MRPLYVVLAVQVALGLSLIALVVTGNTPFTSGSSDESAAAAPRPKIDRFDSATAYELLRRQVELGPRPAGSDRSRELARLIRRSLPNGRFQRVPGGLRNVVGVIPGRSRERVIVGAHYDTKDLPGFVGANDGASGTAVLVQLSRTFRRRKPRSTIIFIAFDGEEAPPGVPDSQFVRRGLRGSKVAAPRYRNAKAMVLLDFVGEHGLRVPREGSSDRLLWKRLRAASRRAGVAQVFPPRSQGVISDDHTPFLRQGVPSIDLIDFDFACFHRRCDDLSRISERSLDAVGETMVELVSRL